MRPDLFDISHHNRIVDRSLVPDVPIVHKVNEGTWIDPTWHDRSEWVTGRNEIFGGYTVLIVSASSIRKQIETYAANVEHVWRPGMFTQLDVEPWDAYRRPVDAGEIIEAVAHHDRLLGAGRCCLYINPRQMPGVLGQVRADLPDFPLWEPHYGAGGEASAVANDATLHQWTDRYPAGGFGAGIDANTVLQPDTLRRLAGLTSGDTVEFINARTVHDTRPAEGGTGRLSAGEIVTVETGEPGIGVAVKLVTAAAAGPGYLTVWKPGAEQPDAASGFNYTAVGPPESDMTMVGTDSAGRFNVYTTDATHLIVELLAVFK